MPLIRTATHTRATDLGYLLHKYPARSPDLSFGQAPVFSPVATDARRTAAPLLDVDRGALVRGRWVVAGGSGGVEAPPEVLQASPETVQPPGHKGVASAQVAQGAVQSAPLGPRAGGGVLEGPLAAGPGEDVPLEVEALVLGGDAGVADVHLLLPLFVPGLHLNPCPVGSVGNSIVGTGSGTVGRRVSLRSPPLAPRHPRCLPHSLPHSLSVCYPSSRGLRTATPGRLSTCV